MNLYGYEEWLPIVKGVAKKLAFTFPDSDVWDIEQSIWEALLKLQAKGKFMTPDEDHTRTTLYYAGQTYCFYERKQHLTISPQYAYRTEDITRMLGTFFEKEWCEMWTPEDAESELGNVGMEMGGDLSRAYSSLSLADKNIIFRRFALNESPDSRKVSRAVTRMADYLNTYVPFKDRRRKAISNSTARYILDTLND